MKAREVVRVRVRVRGSVSVRESVFWGKRALVRWVIEKKSNSNCRANTKFEFFQCSKPVQLTDKGESGQTF